MTTETQTKLRVIREQNHIDERIELESIEGLRPGDIVDLFSNRAAYSALYMGATREGGLVFSSRDSSLSEGRINLYEAKREDLGISPSGGIKVNRTFKSILPFRSDNLYGTVLDYTLNKRGIR